MTYKIRTRHARFMGYIMKQKKLEHLIRKWKIEYKKSRRCQWNK